MKTKLAKLAALVFLSAATASWAQTPTGTVTVSAAVKNVCTLSTSAVAFGNYDPVVANNSSGADVVNNGLLTIACTKGANATTGGTGNAVVIGLGTGNNPTGTTPTRAMKNTTTGITDTLVYDLYLPTQSGTGTNYDTCPNSTVWDTTNTLTPAAAFWTGASRTIKVCGVLPKGQTATGITVGTYQDTVNVYVTF